MTLTFALILDALLGEPKWLWDRMPHPAVIIGKGIDWATKHLNRGPSRKAKGILFTALLCLAAIVIGVFLAQLGWVVQVIVAAILLAQKSLNEHVAQVADGLRMSVAQGRRSVGMIVGRDTSDMDEPAIARAAIESSAENFSDGVVAPAFWFTIAGLPGILLYKAVNTADSMVGYRTDEFEDFGWASARLDDVLNFIPARLTALLLAVPYGLVTGWAAILKDARSHRSPNAGWPEAVMARILNIALAGPRSYDGEMRDLAWVHPTGNKKIGPKDIDRANAVLWRAWAVITFVSTLTWLLI